MTAVAKTRLERGDGQGARLPHLHQAHLTNRTQVALLHVQLGRDLGVQPPGGDGRSGMGPIALAGIDCGPIDDVFGPVVFGS